MDPEQAQDFICNICGEKNTCVLDPVNREGPTCSTCSSSIRLRSIVLILTRELFGCDAPLTSLPVLKSIRGMGISDSAIYSTALEKVFDYQNTYYHKEPYFDLLHSDPERVGKYDFVICSEVMEHVPPPVDVAFANLARLLKPNGVLILTVPHIPGDDNIEHFPALHEYGFADLNGTTVLVNRTAEGRYEVFDSLCFHGGRGAVLELRVFSDAGLKSALSKAGLATVQVHTEGSREHGVAFSGPCSLPVSARSAPFSLGAAGITEIIQQYKDTHDELMKLTWLHKAHCEMESEFAQLARHTRTLQSDLQERTGWAQSLDVQLKELTGRFNTLGRSAWVRLGRRLGLVPRV